MNKLKDMLRQYIDNYIVKRHYIKYIKTNEFKNRLSEQDVLELCRLKSLK